MVKAKTRRVILFMVLAFAAVWDCLCLSGVLPIDKWPFSTGVICMGVLITQIPLLYPSTAPKEENSAYTDTGARRKKERIFAGMLVGLALIWIAATIICLLES